MSTKSPQDHSIAQYAQAATAETFRLVRIDEVDHNNQYLATQLEIAADGTVDELPDAPQMTVFNAAEDSSADGSLAAGTQAIAVEAEGRWLICVPQAAATAFAARVAIALGSAIYRVMPQEVGSDGALCDSSSSTEIEATNLAELTLGDGGAVEQGTIVVVLAVRGGPSLPSSIRYVFDHPVYAKYLD